MMIALDWQVKHFTGRNYICPNPNSWWLSQPNCKILVKSYIISPSRGKNKKSLKPAPTFLWPRISPFRTNIPSSPPALPWHNGHLKTQLLKVFLEGLGWTNSPNSITKQRNKTKKKTKTSKQKATNKTKHNNMIVGFQWMIILHYMQVNYFYTCFQGSTSACKKLAQVQCKCPISHYIIYHYMTMGNTGNLWPTCCPEPAWNCCWTYWEERRWPNNFKKTATDTTFSWWYNMVSQGIAL